MLYWQVLSNDCYFSFKTLLYIEVHVYNVRSFTYRFCFEPWGKLFQNYKHKDEYKFNSLVFLSYVCMCV